MKKVFKYLLAILLMSGVSAGTTLLVLRTTHSDQALLRNQNDSTSIPAAYARFANLPEMGETDFTVAAELSVNAVVHVKTTYAARQQSYPSGSIFDFFFGIPDQHYRQMPQQRGSGSGVIISSDGYIVTNNHVIERASEIEIIMNDKRSFNATLVGTDPSTDIALLKIDATELPVILMGNSDNLRVGEWVLAVGNPFNLTSTVTAGIVSAKARNINILDSDMKIESFIQTDAAVNPGNSGGALVNTRGELVGINTAIASQTGSYAGYSFAVPTSIVQKVVSDLRTYGMVQRAVLGVQLQEINAQLKEEKKLTTLQGAYVAHVVENSAAAKAGIHTGDIITQINAVTIRTVTDLQEQIGRHRPGDKVKVTILRNNQSIVLTAELTNKSGTTAIVKKESATLGGNFEEVSDKLKERLGINYGLVIKSLDAGKLKEAGLQKGFIILKANNRTIRTQQDLQEVYDAARMAPDKDKVLFIAGIHPSGRTGYYAINLNE